MTPTQPRAMSHPSPALPDWRHDHTFTPPERVPWSELAPQFHAVFGNADPADPQPEHLEIFGQNGSGKTHWYGKMAQERAHVTGRASILVATKPVDKVYLKIGFPVVRSWDELTAHVRDGKQNLIFHPRTAAMGADRKAFHNRVITDLLERVYVPEAETDVAIDDWGYAEKLADVKDMLEQYLREARSSGIGVGALKQRPQGSNRLMTSETHWTAAFKPKDESDLERWAEIFGARRDWMPVMRGMSDMKREFLLRHNRSAVAYISWVDKPLTPIDPPRKRRGIAEFLGW